MVQIQIDLPEETSHKLDIYRAIHKHKNKEEAIKELLNKTLTTPELQTHIRG